MLPLGRAILLWRLERRLTQADLARQARIPRPNISTIERGKRDVSLKSLRALALALEVKPGILADGLAPGEVQQFSPLSRQVMERIAEAVAKNRILKDPVEKDLVQDLRRLVTSRLEALSLRKRRPRPIGRATERAWLRCVSRHSPQVVNSLVERVVEHSRPL